MEGAVSENQALDAHLVVMRDRNFRLDVRLTIEPGGTTALLGPNGAGKTTIVQALAGLIPLDAGRISLGGRALDDPGNDRFVPPERRRLGVVFQDYVLFPHLTVAQNIGFGLHRPGLTRREIDGRTETWLRHLGLEQLANVRPAHLSGGQAQRVALARALVTEPDALLLDEPLAALDATTRVELRRVLAEHLEAFVGPRLLITHDPTDAFLLADRIYVIEDGAVSQSGTADEIRLGPRTRYVADLAGSNLFTGSADQGLVRIDSQKLHIADTAIAGPVLVSIHPRAIALYRQQPKGSPRNTWQTHVSLIEDLGERIRLNLENPIGLTAEVTPEALRVLDLRRGSPVWLSIKATEIRVEPA